MFKFGYIDMEESHKSKVLWDKILKDDFNLLMKCKNLYEQCLAYSGRNVHDVNGAAGNLLNGADHFLYSFTEDFINKKYDIDGLNATYEVDGGWEGHTRKFLVEQAIPRALKALNE
jgi:hypothetical protein